MKDWLPVLARARVSLLALVLLGLLCAALLWRAHSANQQACAELALAQQTQDQQQAALHQRQADLRYVQDQLDRLRLLRQSGLIAAPERAAWIEQLEASHRRLGLSADWRYTLAPPRPWPGPAGGAQVHDLEFSLSGVHEGEWLALLQDFRARVRARWRIQACELHDPQAQGLSVHCVLRIFTLTPTGTELAALDATPGTAEQRLAALPPLATLLYSREERAALVREREGEERARLHLSGLVHRAHGPSTAWINQHAFTPGQPLPGVRTLAISPTAVSVDGRHLRVGQTLDLITGQRGDDITPGVSQRSP